MCFSNNTIIDCSKDNTTCVRGTAASVSIEGNLFKSTKNFSFTVTFHDVIHIASGTYDLNINNNKFKRIGNGTSISDGIFNVSNDATKITYVKVDIPARLSEGKIKEANFVICGNDINSENTTNVHNGFHFKHYVSAAGTGDNNIMTLCTLQFKNNSLKMTNMNFGLLSEQRNSSTPFSHLAAIWAWRDVVAVNNEIQAIQQNLSPTAAAYGSDFWSTYGNDDGLSGTDSQGVSYSDVKIVGGNTLEYVGFLDFRFFKAGRLIAEGNSLSLSRDVFGNIDSLVTTEQTIGNADDVNPVAGIRATSFPGIVSIKNNRLGGCPLIIKHNANVSSGGNNIPFSSRANGLLDIDALIAAGASQALIAPKIDISNNNISADRLGCAIDINPACGLPNRKIPGSAASSQNPAFTMLHLKDNTISGFHSTSSYSDHRGVIRLWHESKAFRLKQYHEYADTTFLLAPGGDSLSESSPLHYAGLNTPGLSCMWQVCGNILRDTIFYVTANEEGKDAEITPGTSPLDETKTISSNNSVNGFSHINTPTLKSGNNSEFAFVGDIIMTDTLKGQYLFFDNNTKIYRKNSFHGHSLFGIVKSPQNQQKYFHFNVQFHDGGHYGITGGSANQIKSNRLVSGTNIFMPQGYFLDTSEHDESTGNVPISEGGGKTNRQLDKSISNSTDARINKIGNPTVSATQG